LLLTFRFSSTPPARFPLASSLKRSAHFSVVAFDFSVVINLLFYTAEKPEKSPDRGVCGPGLQGKAV
jgi:hypothetical protein